MTICCDGTLPPLAHFRRTAALYLPTTRIGRRCGCGGPLPPHRHTRGGRLGYKPVTDAGWSTKLRAGSLPMHAHTTTTTTRLPARCRPTMTTTRLPADNRHERRRGLCLVPIENGFQFTQLRSRLLQVNSVGNSPEKSSGNLFCE